MTKFCQSIRGLDICRIACLAIMLTITLRSLPAIAQDAPQGAEVVRDGVEGVWLPKAAHRLILGDLRVCREQGTRIKLLEQKLSLQSANMNDLRIANALAVQAKNEAMGALGAAVAGKRKAEADRDAWHRSRLLWAGIGVVGGVAVTIAITALVTRAKGD